MTVELFQQALVNAAMAGLGFLGFGSIAAYVAYMVIHRNEV